MSENKIKQLNNIEEALKKDDFLLAISFFNADLLFNEYKKRNNEIKETIKNNSNNDTEAEKICKILGLEGDEKIFPKLLNAERKRQMDINEYTVVEKNEADAHNSQIGQMRQAINPGRKLMTYTELTNTLAYKEIFPKIFEKAKEKITNNNNIGIKNALEESIKELTKEAQDAEIKEKLEEKIVEDIGGIEEFNKLGDNKEQKIKEISEKFKEEYQKQIIEEESKEEAERKVYEYYYKSFYETTEKNGKTEQKIIKEINKKIENFNESNPSKYKTKINEEAEKIKKEKTEEFNKRMIEIDKQVLENTKEPNFTENTLKRKQEKLEKRMKSFYDMANKTSEDNKDRYVTFSERYKMSIMVNKLTLKKVNKEIKWGGEKNNFTKDDINKLKEKFINEEKRLEENLKENKSKIKPLKNGNYNYSNLKKEKDFEEEAMLCNFDLCRAYGEGNYEKAEELIKKIEGDEKLEKSYYKLQFKTAVELGDIEGFNRLLKKIKDKKIDIKNFKYNGKDLLSVAVINDNLEMFEVLKGKGFEIDDNLINTVIESENYDLLKDLVKSGEIKDIKAYSYRILSVAAKKGSPKRIETLLKEFEGLNIYSNDLNETGILDIAIKNENIELVKYFLESKGINQESIILENKDLLKLITDEELKEYLKEYLKNEFLPKKLESIIESKNTNDLKEFLKKNKEIIDAKKLVIIKNLAIEKEDFQLLNEVRKINEQCLKDIMPDDAEEKRLFNFIISGNSEYSKKQYERIIDSKKENNFSKFPYKSPLILVIKTNNTQNILSLIDAYSAEDLNKPINNVKFDGTKNESIVKEETILDFAIKNKNTALIRKLVEKEGIDISNENINLILKITVEGNSISILSSLINSNKLYLNGEFNNEMNNLEYIMKNGDFSIIKTVIEHPKVDLSKDTKIFEYIKENANISTESIKSLEDLKLKKENLDEYEKIQEEARKKEEKAREEEEKARNCIIDLNKKLVETNTSLSDIEKFIEKDVKPLNPELSLINLYKGAKDNLLLLIAKEGKEEDLKFFEKNLNFDVINTKNSSELSLIHMAALEGNKDLVKTLIETYKVDINKATERTNQTPPMLAMENKKEDIVNYLIEKDANVTIKSTDNRSVLYYAVENNNIEMVKKLIEKSSKDINQTIEFSDKKSDGREQSLFFIAVENGNQEIIDLFLKQKNLKIDFTETNKKGETLLHYLFNKKNMDLINKLSSFEGFDINVKDKDGKTLLHYAVATGLPVLINSLTEAKDININIKDKNGKTPLHYAIKNNDAIITQSLLIKPKIDVNVKDNKGQSPLFIAVKKGNKEMVECLLNIENIKVEKLSKNEPSPFLMAVKNNNKEIIDLFLERADELKIDFSEEDKNKMSLLHYAAKNNNMELVKKLIDEKKFNPNITNGEKITPLYYAVANGNKEMVEYLLSIESIEIIEPKNASNPFFKAIKVNNKDIIKLFLERADKLKIDFNEQNWNCEDSLLHYAIINGDEEIFDNLINREGIDINIKNTYSYSPLDIAIQKNNKHAINVLIEKGAKIDFSIRNIDNKDILHYAAKNNNTDLMKKLIDKGGFDYINIKDTFSGKTPLHYAAKNNNVELIKQLLDIDGIDLTIKDNNGLTAIDYMDKNIDMNIFKEEYQEIVEDLREKTKQQLKEKENKKEIESEKNKEINSKDIPSKNINSTDDPNQQENKDQIFEILENLTSYDDIISKLKENNFELEDLKTLRNSDGKTLLHIAAENRNQDLVKDLIEKGGLDPNLKDNYNYTPLYYAIENNKNDTKDLEANKENIVGFLLDQYDVQNKINEKLGSGSYKSLLSTAVLSGNAKIVEMLINKGADVNITNSLGQTPIFDAIAIGNKEMIELLANKGADFDIKSNSGKTAVDYAEYYVKNGYINSKIANVVQETIKSSISRTQNTDKKIKDKYPKPENTKEYAKDLEDVKLEQHKLENKLFNPLAIEGSNDELIKEKSHICNILMMRIRTAEKKLEKRKEELNELKEKITEKDKTEEKQKLEKELEKRVEDFKNRVELIKSREEILKTQKEELNLLIDGKKYNEEESNKKYLEQQKKLKEVLSRVYAANRELGGQEKSIG